MRQAPDYTNRGPADIVNDKIYFDSVGYIYRSLSWLEHVKEQKNICALLYSALECRQGIEQLLFEELLLSVGTELDENEYEKCKGNSTKFHIIIRRLNPHCTKLAEFTKAVMSRDPQMPPLQIGNHNKLTNIGGRDPTISIGQEPQKIHLNPTHESLRQLIAFKIHICIF